MNPLNDQVIELEEVRTDPQPKLTDSQNIKKLTRSPPKKDQALLTPPKNSPTLSRNASPRRVNIKSAPPPADPKGVVGGTLHPVSPNEEHGEPYYIHELRDICKLEYVVVIPLVCCLLGFTCLVVGLIVVFSLDTRTRSNVTCTSL